MTVYAITDTKKGEQGFRLLIFKLPEERTQLRTLCRKFLATSLVVLCCYGRNMMMTASVDVVFASRWIRGRKQD